MPISPLIQSYGPNELRISGKPDLSMLHTPLRERRASLLKRAEDLLLATLAAVFGLPAILIVAVCIKLDSPGPIIFRQRRVGRDGHVFWMLKFRTMYIQYTDPDSRQQTIRNDKRITRLGVWLRKTSFDELPQIVNVFWGDMSIIGPRPHALLTAVDGRRLEDVVPMYSSRHCVKPGITGWAQVNACRGELDSIEKAVRRIVYDLYYVENWSLALDLRILWRTAQLILEDKNAY